MRVSSLGVDREASRKGNRSELQEREAQEWFGGSLGQSWGEFVPFNLGRVCGARSVPSLDADRWSNGVAKMSKSEWKWRRVSSYE